MRRYKPQLTFMVLGRKSTGKSTFLNTLLNLKTNPNNDINMYLLDIECEGMYKKITAIDTPGLNEFIVDKIRIDNIVNFIKHQHDLYLMEETKVSRNINFIDTRVHCLIYFISPSKLTEYDVEYLKAVNMLVNIIPVIGKGDSLSYEEEKAYKIKIRNILEKNEIRCFDLENKKRNRENKDGEVEEECEEEYEDGLYKKMPFCIVSGESRMRDYESGRIEVDNPNHCDFSVLKDILFNTHCEALIEQTDLVIYEKYRTEVLSGLLTKNN